MKRIIPLLLVLSLLLCSCNIEEVDVTSPPAEDAAAEEYKPDTDTFGVAFASNESTNPYTTSNKLNIELMGLICEPLFSVSESFAPTPVLCEDYTYSDLEYRLNIKSGVTFSDGTALRPSDVEYSLREAMAPGSYYASRLGVISSVSSSNKKGYVTIKLRYDNARLASLLDIPIIKSGTKDNLLPIGTGIYAPKDDLSSLLLREGHHSGKTSKYSVIPMYDVSSSDELMFEFDTHNVSVYTSDPTGTNSSAPQSSVDRTNVPTTRLHYIVFNVRKGALADKNVRRAIARAIDRESAATSDFALMGVPAALPVHPASAVYSESAADPLAYDNETPITVSEPLTILVNSENSGKLAACKRIAETLTRLGAPTTVRALPYSEYTSALSGGDFTLAYAEVSIGADFDITRLISGSLNYGGFSDASMNAALAAYLAGDEGLGGYFRTFCDTVPFAPIMFKDTAMYTQENFFEKVTPSSQNVYYGFCDWVIKE